jgi:hypothetical protein
VDNRRSTLVIFDFWYYFFRNKRSDDRISLDFLESLTKRYDDNNICVYVNHHSNQGTSKGGLSNVYGDSRIIRYPSFVFELEKRDMSIRLNTGDVPKEILAKCSKSRLGKELAPFAVVFTQDEDTGKLTLSINRKPTFGNNKHDKLWDITHVKYGGGKSFKKSDIMKLKIASEGHVKGLLKTWTAENRIIMKGRGPDTHYIINTNPY